jgi:hypothetical protein
LGKHRATLNSNHCYETLKGLKKEMRKEKEYHKVSHEIERHIKACGHKGIAEYFKKLNEEHSHINEKYEKYLVLSAMC